MAEQPKPTSVHSIPDMQVQGDLPTRRGPRPGLGSPDSKVVKPDDPPAPSPKKGNPQPAQQQARTAKYQSVDGKTYEFDLFVVDKHGRPELPLQVDPKTHLRMLFCAIRELRLGGDPLVVFQAWGFTFKDKNGQDLYPVVDAPTMRIAQLFDADPGDVDMAFSLARQHASPEGGGEGQG